MSGAAAFSAPLLDEILAAVKVTSDGAKSALSDESFASFRGRVQQQHHEDPELCLALVFASTDLRAGGLVALADQLIVLAKLILGGASIEDTLKAARSLKETKQKKLGGAHMDRPAATGAGLKRNR